MYAVPLLTQSPSRLTCLDSSLACATTSPQTARHAATLWGLLFWGRSENDTTCALCAACSSL